MPSITGISHVDLSVTNLQASLAWYCELLGAVELMGGRNDAHDLDVRYILEPTSGVIIGLEQHDANEGTPFDEKRVGLDHLAFNVASREELDAWLARLEELGISNSGIHEERAVGRARVPRPGQHPAGALPPEGRSGHAASPAEAGQHSSAVPMHRG